VLILQNELSDKLGANVSIQAKPSGAGTLKIQYASLDQLETIIERIKILK
jgi:ParB family chromosome partitioning protein